MSEKIRYATSTTGRIKAAGVPFDLFFDATKEYRDNPTVTGANSVRKYFQRLRHNPPDEVRDRFLPRNRGSKEMFRNGPMLTRPILKTDQGAGQFTVFDSGKENGTANEYHIQKEIGFVIPERSFYRQLAECGFPPAIMEQLAVLGKTFESGDVHETQLAYEQLQMICEPLGIQTTNDAKIGREAVFFIHPAQTKNPAIVSAETHQKVRQTIREISQVFPQMAGDAKNRFASHHGLTISTDRFYEPIYFQADIQLMPDNNTRLDQIQLPDVGLFLSALNPNGNMALRNIQEKVKPIKDNVINALAKKFGPTDRPVHLITRPEVLAREEDTLEIMEIQVLTKELSRRGISAKTISLEQAMDLAPEDQALLLNINPKTEAFQRLLQQRLQDDRTAIYPDPFLLSAVKEMTQYDRRVLTGDQLQGLQAIVGELEPDSSPNKQYTQLRGLNDFLNGLDLPDDVFHIHIGSQPTPVACYRYDIRGFQIAASAIRDGDKAEIRSVPINPEKAVLFNNQDRPVYCVFRYMATLTD